MRECCYLQPLEILKALFGKQRRSLSVNSIKSASVRLEQGSITIGQIRTQTPSLEHTQTTNKCTRKKEGALDEFGPFQVDAVQLRHNGLECETWPFG